jgi:ArsR family transcriptional regulator
LKFFDARITLPPMTKATASLRRSRETSEACCPTPGKLRTRATAGYARLFRALSDATRLELVGLLAAQKKELCVCELEAHFDLSQSTVSHHLRILREAGIVSSERRGTWVYYALEDGVRQKLRSFDELLGS